MRLGRSTATAAAAAATVALLLALGTNAQLRGGSIAAAAAGNATDERLLAEIKRFLADVGAVEVDANGDISAAAASSSPPASPLGGPGAADKQAATGQNQYSGSLTPLLDIYMDPRGVSDRSPSKHWLFPACGFAAPILESPAYCPLGLVVERVGEAALRRNRGNLIVTERTMYETEKEPAQGVVPLPVRLTDIGHPIPFLVTNQTVVEAERHTFYWYQRTIINFYLYVKRCITANAPQASPGPFVPQGYHDARIFFTPEERETADAPIGQSFVKGDHLILIMRGTIYAGGWIQDATFRYADPALTRAAGLQGDIHEGFFSQTMGLVEQLQEEIDRHPEVTRVSIAGHSLGGAHSQLVSAVIAIRHPHLEVEAFNMGAPPLGSQAFVDQYASLPNLRTRSVMYLGDGLQTQRPTPFSVGDVIPQPPGGCWPVRGCPFTHHPDTSVRVKYEATHGIVAFYAKDMPNSDGWRQVDQVITSRSSVSACHGCTYLCWSVQGLDDPEDRCWFPDQRPNDPFPCPYTRLSD